MSQSSWSLEGFQFGILIWEVYLMQQKNRNKDSQELKGTISVYFNLAGCRLYCEYYINPTERFQVKL